MIGQQSVKSQVSLSDEQQAVVEAIVRGVRRGKAAQTLGGHAGTGKPTSIRALRCDLPDFAVGAYTGKAANMLRRKGIEDARTIHSLIYIPEKDRNGKVYFRLRDEMDPDVTGFIIDEASMVGESIYRDLASFGLPMIYVGDHGQLEPIERGFNLMADPQYKLETIHRNAGEIPRFAQWLRMGRDARRFRPSSDAVVLIDSSDIDDSLLMGADQCICGFNKTRVALNTYVRNLEGRKDLVEAGERVMCLRNNRDEGIFNGMQGSVVAVRKLDGGLQIDFDTYDGIHESISIDPAQFGKEKGPDRDSSRFIHPFDYAYWVTAHKAQGDEWERVLVIEEKCRAWDHRRWTYTAASRAQERLYWACPGGGR